MADKKDEVELPTAGIIIIGDEILRGQTQDTNTHFLSKKLYHFGVKVQRVSVIPDDLATIAKEVSEFSKDYTFVLTSGGVGPTHDDITYEGVAAAFSEKVVPHPDLIERLKFYFKTDDMTSPAMKMGHIPESAVLEYGEDKVAGVKARWPVISVKNVTIFPGVPHLLEKSFSLLGEKLFSRPGVGFHSRTLYLTSDEVSMAPILNETVSQFPDVSFGSYPKLFHSYYKTKITMESLNPKLVEEAEQYFKEKLNKDWIIDYTYDTVSTPWSHIEKLLTESSSLKQALTEALDIINQCFDKYTPEEICVCYNAGKDCLVVLHLAYAILQQRQPGAKLQAVYITEHNGNGFPQTTQFVQESIVRYDLDCEVIPGPMKGALAEVLNKRQKIKAMIMGTRSTDPYSSNLEFFSPTDNGWPQMLRVNPILNWSYSHVWDLIRGLYLPYCELYDRGYTSLGSQDNTLPNPALQTTDRLGQVTYLPAHKLTQPELERKGRISSKQ